MDNILQAKLDVIAAGKRLLETGLIARTWGNVSARVDDKSFVITPSGKAYEDLTPDDIVLVNISDLSYEGDIKPSSEKGIHAQAYARPEVGFVIHTHQHNASIVSVMGKPMDTIEWWVNVLGPVVPLAGYGLPGTGKLKKAVTLALQQNPSSKAVVMANHGALCVGTDADDAFRVADALEQQCLGYLKAKASSIFDEAADTLDALHSLIARRRAANAPCEATDFYDAYSSFRSGSAFCMVPENGEGESIDVALPSGDVFDGANAPASLEIHRAIYRGDKKANAIVHSQKPDIIRASKTGGKLKPYLDDFAQIAGINLRTARFNPNDQLASAQAVKKGLNRRSAVLLKDNGALCIGSSMDEARAVETVTEKNCAVSLSADLFGKAKKISLGHSVLMRFVYVQKYSKKK